MKKGKEWLKDEINVLYREVELGELEFNEQWVLKHMFDLVDQLEEPEKRADDALYNIAGLMTDYKNVGTLNEVDLIREIHNELMSYYQPKEKRYRIRIGKDKYVQRFNDCEISSLLTDKELAAQFTEQEIKDIDERFWTFAVPVEEDSQ